MMKKQFEITIIIAIAIVVLAACTLLGFKEYNETVSARNTPSAHGNINATARNFNTLMNDLNISEDERSLYHMAIEGHKNAQDELRNKGGYPLPIYYIADNGGRPSNVAPEEECHYNIANMYYNGWKDILFVDKEKASQWLLTSSEKGYFSAAIKIGDMLMDGDGIAVDEAMAYSQYERALELMPSGISYRRLG